MRTNGVDVLRRGSAHGPAHCLDGNDVQEGHDARCTCLSAAPAQTSETFRGPDEDIRPGGKPDKRTISAEEVKDRRRGITGNRYVGFARAQQNELMKRVVKDVEAQEREAGQ